MELRSKDHKISDLTGSKGTYEHIFFHHSAGGWRLAAGGLALAVLSSCGGGGGSAPPVAAVSITPAQPPITINGIVVPPAPSTLVATLGGTDSNANGIRDDAERAIATRVGATPAVHTPAVAAAKLLQTAITSTSGSSGQAMAQYVAQQACGVPDAVSGASVAQDETLDTRERQQAAIKAYLASLNPSAPVGTLASGVIACN